MFDQKVCLLIKINCSYFQNDNRQWVTSFSSSPSSFPPFTQLPGNYFKITSKKGLRLQIYTRHHENTNEVLVKGSEFIAKEILFVLFKFLAISKAEKEF